MRSPSRASIAGASCTTRLAVSTCFDADCTAFRSWLTADVTGESVPLVSIACASRSALVSVSAACATAGCAVTSGSRSIFPSFGANESTPSPPTTPATGRTAPSATSSTTTATSRTARRFAPKNGTYWAAPHTGSPVSDRAADASSSRCFAVCCAALVSASVSCERSVLTSDTARSRCPLASTPRTPTQTTARISRRTTARTVHSTTRAPDPRLTAARRDSGWSDMRPTLRPK